MSVKRSELLSHIHRTRFAPGDAAGARLEAQRIADYLEASYGAEVWGIGSLFEGIREFRQGSDIDLVAKGIPGGRFLDAMVAAEAMTTFNLDLIPWETANELVREIVLESGVRL